MVKIKAIKHNKEPEKDQMEESLKFNERDNNQEVNSRLIEDIMSECGDMILRIFHSNNLTYSDGMNFENLIEIIQRNDDQESLRIMNTV